VTDEALRHLGWNDQRRDEFAPLAAAGLMPGRVSLEHNQFYRVLTDAGERLAEATGRMKHAAGGRDELPVVGDWVGLRLDASSDRAQIREILTRRTRFSRKVAGRVTVEQVLAANIDTVFVVFAIAPTLKARGIERYLAASRRSGARPVVVLNKTDLTDDVDGLIRDAQAVAGDHPVLAMSAQASLGIDQMEAYLGEGQTVVLLGPSGVGKSSIVNRLVGEERLPTGEVRPWDSRGRHTSVHRQLLVRAAGGVIIDTPGIRELQLWHSDGSVDDEFIDIAEIGEGCRFRDCRHDREPGCAVKAAVDGGLLAQARYQNFLKLQHEEEVMNKKKDERLQKERDRR
jgi:ribosome biogenesis GTPase / thiamine phosphate phosphatase